MSLYCGYIILVLSIFQTVSASAPADSASCDRLLADFDRRDGAQTFMAPDPQKMLFFLHVPRTAGRTYHSCFLKLAHPPSKRCAKSYDVLRLNVSMGSCGLLSSHDDYSATDFLPPEAAIVTQLRDPVGRVLSAYEFAVEVAARVLTRPKNYTADPQKTNTRDVWPWSVLVPIVEETMLERVEANKHAKGASPDEPLNPYDNPLLMPLEEFLSHPAVDDLLGNGAAMQVLGITSYSHWPEAAALRECARNSPAVQRHLLQVAEGRLRRMLHVGLTEELDLSIASLSATLGIKLGGKSWQAATPNAFSYESQGSPPADEAQVATARGQLQSLITTLNDKRREVGQAQQRWWAEKQQLTAQRQAGGDTSEPQQPSWLTDAQADLGKLQDDVEALRKEARIVGAHEARGPARQILPDDNFLQSLSVRDAYHDCSQKATARNNKRKANSLRGLVTSDGRRVEFHRAAREKWLTPRLSQLIRERNAMDVELHQLGSAMLHTKVEQQHAATMLEAVPLRGQHSRRARVRERLPEPPPVDDTGTEGAANSETDGGAAANISSGGTELRDEL